MGIRWNIYLGTSTPDIMRTSVCVCVGVYLCGYVRMPVWACGGAQLVRKTV